MVESTGNHVVNLSNKLKRVYQGYFEDFQVIGNQNNQYLKNPGFGYPEILAISVEDFATSSNKTFIHVFSILFASHYVFHLLYATFCTVVYSTVFRNSSNIVKIYWQRGTLFIAFCYSELRKAIKITRLNN